MTFEEYHNQTHKTAIYPKNKGISYTALGLGGEVGEVQGIVKKAIRGDFKVGNEKDRPKMKKEIQQKLSDELGDVFWYLSRLIHEAGLDASDILRKNVDKLNERLETGNIKSIKGRDN